MANETLDFTKALIAQPSVTPEDKHCQPMMIERLEAIGFNCTSLKYADEYGEVDNLWAVLGDKGPILCFAGHTDVVPSGPIEGWASHPFEPTIRDGYLYGRGAADMKTSLAAMVVACERMVEKAQAENLSLSGRIAFLITSDEEGPATCGTIKVIEWLEENDTKITYCVVGEPSSTDHIGDIIKNGRRGSLGAKLTVKGIQGHVAYPHLASNPIHLVTPALTELSQEVWDEGNDFFPATSFQISNINSGTGATNVIPGEAEVIFNFRFSTELTSEILQQRAEAILNKHGFDYDIEWNLSGQPFLTSEGKLVDATKKAIMQATQLDTVLSTAGGTSDGRFIAPTGAQVVEVGPVNATIHKVDECVKVDDIEPLTDIFQHIIEQLSYTNK
ncbi:MAG: succinyl-diaminopimelate desuccinylase [Sinobacterium sp.]|nr:succinyl-diaminopimelate desuccinylase [Sinobacterium sp.]